MCLVSSWCPLFWVQFQRNAKRKTGIPLNATEVFWVCLVGAFFGCGFKGKPKLLVFFLTKEDWHFAAPPLKHTLPSQMSRAFSVSAPAHGSAELPRTPCPAKLALGARGGICKRRKRFVATPGGGGGWGNPFTLFGGEGSPSKIGYTKKWYPYSVLSTGGPRMTILAQSLVTSMALRECGTQIRRMHWYQRLVCPFYSVYDSLGNVCQKEATIWRRVLNYAQCKITRVCKPSSAKKVHVPQTRHAKTAAEGKSFGRELALACLVAVGSSGPFFLKAKSEMRQ